MWNRTPAESQEPPPPPNSIHGKGPDARQLQPQLASGPYTVVHHLCTSPGHQGGSQAERSSPSVHCSAEDQSQGNRGYLVSFFQPPVYLAVVQVHQESPRSSENQVDRNFFSPIKMLTRESGREHQGLCAHMLHKQGLQLVHSRP